MLLNMCVCLTRAKRRKMKNGWEEAESKQQCANKSWMVLVTMTMTMFPLSAPESFFLINPIIPAEAGFCYPPVNNPSTSTHSLTFGNTKTYTHIIIFLIFFLTTNTRQTKAGNRKSFWLSSILCHKQVFFLFPTGHCQPASSSLVLVSYDFFFPGLRYVRFPGVPYCTALTMNFESYCMLPGRPDCQRRSPGINPLHKIAPWLVLTGPLQRRS